MTRQKPETETPPHPTPRPWEAVQCQCSGQWWIERRVDGHKAAIARVGIGNYPNACGGTAEEDARFIERACNLYDDLLTSCRELAELVLNYCPDEDRIRSLASVGCPAYGAYQRACCVLAKADSQAPTLQSFAAFWEPAVNGKRWFLISKTTFPAKYYEDAKGRLIFFRSHEAAKRKADKLNAPALDKRSP
jgi:hypothetical protein